MSSAYILLTYYSCLHITVLQFVEISYRSGWTRKYVLIIVQLAPRSPLDTIPADTVHSFRDANG